jgi:beta-lactamase regulating signal transducer with metallopeptidase domain
MSAGFLVEATLLLLCALALGAISTNARQRAAQGFVVVCALPLLWLADSLHLGWQPIVRQVSAALPIDASVGTEWTWIALVAGYAWITLWQLLRWLGAHFALLRLRRGAQHGHSDRWERLSAEVARASGRRRVPVRVHAAIGAPFLAGPLRPCIYIPAHLEFCAEARARQVLWHEYAHLCAQDGWRVAIVELAICLLWFHPLLHILRRRFLRDIELACDEQVLRTGADAHDYAATLAHCAGRHRHLAAAGLGMAVRQSDLVRRIREILSADFAAPAPVRRWMTAALCIAIVMLFSLNLAPRILRVMPEAWAVASTVIAQQEVAAIPEPVVAELNAVVAMPMIEPQASRRTQASMPTTNAAAASLAAAQSAAAAPDSARLWQSLHEIAAEDAAVYAISHREPMVDRTALDPRFENGLRRGRAERHEQRQRVMKRIWPLFGRVPL